MSSRQRSPKEQVARAMLLLHHNNPVVALQTLNRTSTAIQELFDGDPYATAEDGNRVAEQVLLDLGYVTDLDSVQAQHEHLSKNHAGLWAGNYGIVDSNHEFHALLVNGQQVRLLLGGHDEVLNVPSEGGGFSGRSFAAENDRVRVELRFETPADDINFTDSSVDFDQLTATFRITLSGTIEVKGDETGARKITGKKDAFTPAGVFADGPGEPARTWVGAYQVRYTDDEHWSWLDHDLVITEAAEDGALEVRLGDQQATQVSSRNNVITCRLAVPGDDEAEVFLNMRATSRGRRRCLIWFRTAGQFRTLTGYGRSRLDAKDLWPQGMKAGRAERPRAVGKIVDFCRTVYDSLFETSELVADEGAPSALDPANLFGADTMTVVTDEGDITVSGFKVNEVGDDGNSTGRVILFDYPQDATALRFLAGAKLKAYQELDEARLPQSGAAHARVGVLAPAKFELPNLVETDFYEVRVSLLEPEKIHAEGLQFELAIDDPDQRRLLTLEQPDVSVCAEAQLGWGPDEDTKAKVQDFKRASVLVRTSTGETQNAGMHDYYFAVHARSGDGVFQATRTTYAPTGDGKYQQQGEAVSVGVPILMHVPIMMQSMDATELSGTEWAPATRGKKYVGKITAMRGLQPFTWRVLTDDRPLGLNWDKDAVAGSDVRETGLVSFGMSGTIDAQADPGDVYKPSIRVMSDNSVVMAPVIAGPQLTIAEPETEGQLTHDWLATAAAIIGGVDALAMFFLTIHLWNRDKNRDKERERKEQKDAANNSVEMTEFFNEGLAKFSASVDALAEGFEEAFATREVVEKLNERIARRDNAIVDFEARIEQLEAELAQALEEGLDEDLIDELEDQVDRVRDEVEEGESRRNEDSNTNEEVDRRNEMEVD